MLGDISNETGNRDADMGYTGTGSHSPNALSLANPAYYHYQVYPFVPAKFAYLDFSVASRITNYTSTSGSDASVGGNLNRLALLLPMNRNKNTIHKWGSVIAARPYSSKNYDFVMSGKVENDTLGFTSSNNGGGGLSEILWGNGVKLSENWMVGLNASYLFGKYTSNTTTKLDGTSVTQAYTKENRQTYVLLKPGIAYVKQLSRYDSVKTIAKHVDSLSGEIRVDTLREYKKVSTPYVLNLGATFERGYALSNSEQSTKRVYDGNLTEYVLDTLTDNNLNKYHLPASLKVGASIVKLDEYMILPYWTLNADLGTKLWSLSHKDLGYRNTWSLGIGAERQVLFNKNGQRSMLSYLRAGAYYNQLPYQFNNQYIDELGITFGATFRLKGVKGLQDVVLLNSSVALGQRGTTANNLISEKFIKFTLGFTFLEDRWFRKYRLD
ncbi:MAG TPA: hypothetical protein VL947_00120 [Cytophagales bacterium]|nr:hypothetical protein [Cytophagales bacterium]